MISYDRLLACPYACLTPCLGAPLCCLHQQGETLFDV
jgi:hypothetical protein